MISLYIAPTRILPIVLFSCLFFPATGRFVYAQTLVSSQSDTVVAAGPQYAATWLHRLFFGDLKRDQWAMPVRVLVLDLEQTAGGISPMRRGGGVQTLSLRFQDDVGKQYKFRTMDKDLSKILPLELRSTFVTDVLQDLISTAHPYGALVAAPILSASGVLNAEPELVVLPDSPRLDTFRAMFARRIGMFELHPDEVPDEEVGFAGSDKVVGTYSLFEKMQKSSKHRVHAAAFLKARMLDVFMGDWDRHTDQWRWARFGNETIDYWHPIPRDRDQAFCKYDGLMPWIATIVIPQLESCDESYPQMQYLTYSGRHLDRRFLSRLPWSAWDSVLQQLLPILSDSLLAYAANRLPASADTKTPSAHDNDDRLAMYSLLISRRNKLPEAVREYYELLAAEAYVYCSDEDEYVEVDRHSNGDVTVVAKPTRRLKRGEADAVFFQRRYLAEETNEIRIYLEDGDDRCVVRGNSVEAIKLRVIGGDGADHFVDSSSVRAPLLGFLPVSVTAAANTFHDSGRKTVLLRGPSSVLDMTQVPVPSTPLERYEPMQRDWGSEWLPSLLGAWNADLGMLVGGGVTLKRYGFRCVPCAYKLELEAGIAPFSGLGMVVARGDFRHALPGASLLIDAGISGFEVIYYFGEGNETVRIEDGPYSYAVKQTQVFLRPRLRFPLLTRLHAELGASVRLVTSDLDDELLFLNVVKPLGYQQTSLLDMRASLEWDSRDLYAWPTEGLYFNVEGAYFPGMLDLPSGFASGSFDARAYISPDYPFPMTIALRTGGRQLWGEYPFFESAFLGGLASARGFEINRFAGDAMLHGGLELRVPLTRYKLIFPTDFGLFGFVESGRVYLDNEESRRWHSSFGGGLWIAPVYREYTISASVGFSDESLRFDVAAGFAF
jgi:hypothetical protein